MIQHFGKHWQWVEKLKTRTPYNIAIPLQGLYILEKLARE